MVKNPALAEVTMKLMLRCSDVTHGVLAPGIVAQDLLNRRRTPRRPCFPPPC